jgi:hypothetical protein
MLCDIVDLRLVCRLRLAIVNFDEYVRIINAPN